MTTYEILDIIKAEFILTELILRLRFPEVNFEKRKDMPLFRNEISKNKSELLIKMLKDKRYFDINIYEILTNENVDEEKNTININIVK